MLFINIEEYKTSDPIILDAGSVHYLMSEHTNHISLNFLKDGRYSLTAKSYVGFIALPDIVISIIPKVPNYNLIYMLCYLFDIPTGSDVQMSKDSQNPLLDVISMVLINKINLLIKSGMFRGYIKKTEHLPGLKGKLPVSKNLLFIDKLYCEFEELSYSVSVNLILKSTLRLLLKLNLSTVIKEKARILVLLMAEISDIELDERLFSRVFYSRLNTHYKLLIDYCHFIYRSINITNRSGSVQFSSFLIDMNVLFEEFIRCFLQNKIGKRFVRKRTIYDWAFGNRSDLIPVIEPDIVIEDKLVIDVKYYREILTDRGKLKSSNLYQIITYMNSLKLPGLLLYPQNSNNIKEKFNTNEGDGFSVYSIDLSGSNDLFINSLNSMLEFINEITVKKVS